MEIFYGKYGEKSFDTVLLQNLKSMENVINENDKREVLLIIIKTLTVIEHKLNMKQLLRIFEVIKKEIENQYLDK